MLKSLIALQLVYILSSLPTNQQLLDEFKNIFYKFRWDGKGDKIEKRIMISDYGNGGLNMIDLNSLTKHFKSYPGRQNTQTTIIVENGSCCLIFNYNIMVDQSSSEVTSTERTCLNILMCPADLLIAKIVQIWAEISFDESIKSIDHLFSLNLWHNSLIKGWKQANLLHTNHGPLEEFQRLDRIGKTKTSLYPFHYSKNALISNRTSSLLWCYIFYTNPKEYDKRTAPFKRKL